MDDDREWRFTVDEGGEISDAAEDEIEALRSKDPEPGAPSIENAFFVALGALLTALVILMMLGLV